MFVHSGCVEVVGCVRGEELKSWDKVPDGVGSVVFLLHTSVSEIPFFKKANKSIPILFEHRLD